MSSITVAGWYRGVLKAGLAGSAIGIVILCFAVSSTRGQEKANPLQAGARLQQTTDKAAEQSPAHKYFTDILLVNQNGEKMRFYSDLLQGKVVIINSFFGTCQGSCLPMNRNLERLQQALGNHVGKDVHIVSISVDPIVDTAARLKEYARNLHARPGWYFLTGDKQNVDFALNKLGQFVSDKQDHLNIIIIGNERISRFAAHLPLSNDFRQLANVGTRHSAALGLAELSDAPVGAIARPVQWVVSPGGSARVRATIRSATSGPKGLTREGRVLSRSRPSTPSWANRSCQRQTTVLLLAVWRMIATVPSPSAVANTIPARQTCFCGLLRSATIASRRSRSAAVTSTTIPVRIAKARTSKAPWESTSGLDRHVQSTS